MSHCSEVLAAIVDSKIRLNSLLHKIKGFSNPEEQKIFSAFKWVQMENNTWAYVFYYPNIRWCKAAQNAWRVISRSAKTFKSSYIFYRLGDDYTDTEMDEYYASWAKNYRYLLEVATLQRRLILDNRIQSIFENQL